LNCHPHAKRNIWEILHYTALRTLREGFANRMTSMIF
jgi:hypothetical protein